MILPFLFSAFSFLNLSYSATQETIATDSARVYAGPTEAAQVMGVLKRGTRIQIEGSAGGGFVVTKVKVKGVPTNAYIKKDQLSGGSSETIAPRPSQAEQPAAELKVRSKKRSYVALAGGLASVSNSAFNEGGGGVIKAKASSYSVTGGGVEFGYEIEPQIFITGAAQYFSGKVDWVLVANPNIADQINVNTLAIEGGADYYFLPNSAFQVGVGAAAKYYLSTDVTVSSALANLTGTFSVRSALDLLVRVTPQYSLTKAITLGLQGGYWVSSKTIYTGAVLRYFL